MIVYPGFMRDSLHLDFSRISLPENYQVVKPQTESMVSQKYYGDIILIIKCYNSAS